MTPNRAQHEQRRAPTLLLCAVLALGQAPAQREARAPATPARHDTIYVAAQSPPRAIIVEAPNQVPAVVLGILGLVLVGLQVWLMRRQTGIMVRQTSATETQSTLLGKQTALGEQQAEWRRDEAIGTFYRLAFDLVGEFNKANELPGTPLPVDFGSHPRQVLREASRLFAPLGTDVTRRLNAAALELDNYFTAVAAYNRASSGRAGAALWTAVQESRLRVGDLLDDANAAIPESLRWNPKNGEGQHFFREMYSPPSALGFTSDTQTSTP